MELEGLVIVFCPDCSDLDWNICCLLQIIIDHYNSKKFVFLILSWKMLINSSKWKKSYLSKNLKIKYKKKTHTRTIPTLWNSTGSFSDFSQLIFNSILSWITFNTTICSRTVKDIVCHLKTNTKWTAVQKSMRCISGVTKKFA